MKSKIYNGMNNSGNRPFKGCAYSFTLITTPKRIQKELGFENGDSLKTFFKEKKIEVKVAVASVKSGFHTWKTIIFKDDKVVKRIVEFNWSAEEAGFQGCKYALQNLI